MEKKNQIPKYPPLRFPEFTDEWKECKISDYGTVVTGSTPSTKDVENYEDDGFLWASPADIDGNKFIERTKTTLSSKGFDKTRKLPPLSVLAVCIGSSIGKLAMAKNEMATNQQINSIVSNPLHSPEFVYYAITSRFRSYLSAVAVQAVPIISKSTFERLPNSTTSLPEQRKIAALLSLIDERIEVQNAIIKEQEVAKTLLSKELLTPENDWTEYAVQDCLTYEQPAKYIVKHTDYSSDSTLTPVLTANKGFILGYTSEQGIYQKGACIIFDDFTLDCKYVPFAFKVKSSAIKILQARKGFDIRFMFEVIKSLSLSPFAHKRHYISEVEPIKILVPSFAKQEKIARLFAALDECLDVERAYAEQLKQQKAYLLRQMFI
jgi:type I restriction enzyme ecoR124II specificity protein